MESFCWQHMMAQRENQLFSQLVVYSQGFSISVADSHSNNVSIVYDDIYPMTFEGLHFKLLLERSYNVKSFN